MAIAIVAHDMQPSVLGNTATVVLNTTGANLLVVFVGDYIGGSQVTPSDLIGGNSNTWTNRTTYASGLYARARISYVANPAFTGSSHTFHYASTGVYAQLKVWALSGANTSAPFDVEDGGFNDTAGTTYQYSTGVTPSTDGQFIAAGITGNTPGVDQYTITLITKDDHVDYSGGSNNSGAAASEIQTTATTRRPTWGGLSGSGSYDAIAIATFKAAAAGAADGQEWLTRSEVMRRHDERNVTYRKYFDLWIPVTH